MEQDYDKLEKTIGDIGGETSTDENKGNLVGKKLRNPAAYGGKEELSKTDKDDMADFLNRSKTVSEKKKEVKMEVVPGNPEIQGGWIPVDRAEMGQRSDFYPAGWEFFVRAATLNSIKNWTAIDETRPDQVNRVFNEIMKTCVMIDTHDISKATYQSINSWDRFWFIMKIREYTFPTGETAIEFNDLCSECGEEMTYKLDSKGLFFDYPDEEITEKYWQGTKWVIDPAEYGVENTEPVTLYPPKLGKDEAIIEWATARIRNNMDVDEVFLKFLMYMLDRPSKDPQMLDRQINKLFKVYKGWSYDMFSFMDDVITNIQIIPKENLKCTCQSCGREATSNVQFPNGVKALFAIKSNVKKFGSR